MLALLLAQADPTGWGDFVTKVGLGAASFLALCYGGFYVVRYLLGELKESRSAFLIALDKQHEDHAKENHLLAEQQDRNTDRIVDAINSAFGGNYGGRSNGSGRGG